MNSLALQLRALDKCLRSQRIQYAIIGGIAVSLYGEPRFTADIDVNVLLDKRKVGDFLKTSAGFGFYPLVEYIGKMAEETGVLALKFQKGETSGRLDVILAENLLEHAAIRRSVLKKIATTKVRVASPEDLVLHKIASSRPRDLEDLKGILARQKGNLDIRYIDRWLKRIDSVDKKSGLLRKFHQLILQTGT